MCLRRSMRRSASRAGCASIPSAAARKPRSLRGRRPSAASVGRRALATIDFGAAARAALALGGAEYLDHTPAHAPNEMVVTYRHMRKTLVCTCDVRTLRIIDAGVCLRGNDALFSLESLPTVVREAEERGILVIERRPPGWRGDDWEDR